MPRLFRCYRDESCVAQAAAECIAEEARAAVDARGVFRIALSGGRTPQATLRLLAGATFAGLPWDKFQVYWVDERYVPADHTESNYRMARETLLSHVPIPEGNIHPIPTLAGDPMRDASAYDAVLRQNFPKNPWPRFDLVLLGLGEDGHTASLFPGDPALQEKHRWVSYAFSPKGIGDRITLTLPALNRARLRMCIVCGSDKASILYRVLRGETQPLLPAQRLHRTVYFVDRAAAAQLPNS